MHILCLRDYSNGQSALGASEICEERYSHDLI